MNMMLRLVCIAKQGITPIKILIMLPPVGNLPGLIGFSQPAIVIYGYRSELLAKLVTYLAAVSVAIWLGVIITVVLRAGAHHRYKSVRRLQAQVKKRSAYR
jgi:hypothetical protein